jgi:hypothetical protein
MYQTPELNKRFEQKVRYYSPSPAASTYRCFNCFLATSVELVALLFSYADDKIKWCEKAHVQQPILVQ